MASVSTSLDIGSPPDRVRYPVTDLVRLDERVTLHREPRDAAGGVAAARAGNEAAASQQREAG